MRRLALICVVTIFISIIIGLCQTAVDPGNFTGQWYSSDDQTLYLFQDGLIFSQKHGISLSETMSISGAYTFCRASVVLFAEGMDGLEKERELYLIQREDCSFLCENKDGTGKSYFIRYNK